MIIRYLISILTILLVFSTFSCNKLPISSFTFTPTTGDAPLEVTFDASASYDPDGTIIKYEWDFSDGSHAQTAYAVHTFETQGEYTTRLRVTDNDNASATSSQQIYVGSQDPLLLSAHPFYLFIPPGAHDLAAQISLEFTSENGIDRVRILPTPLTYNSENAPLLYYMNPSVTEDTGTIVYVDEESKRYVFPSMRIPGMGCMTFILHNSEYEYVRKTFSSRVNVSGEEINVWEMDIELCNTGFCDYTTFNRAVDHYLRNLGYETEGWAMGVTSRFCKFQSENVSITSGTKTNTKKVTIEEHSPDFSQAIFIPGESDFMNIMNCSQSEKSYISNYVLDHEMLHAQINLEWENGDYGSTMVQGMIVDNIPVYGLSDREIMEFAYLIWCRKNVTSRLEPYHKEFDQSDAGKIDYSKITCECALGSIGPDPDLPEIKCIDCSKKTYCPCDDPAHGKPRNYATAAECATKCPSGLKCFAVQCTIPPICNEER